MCAAFILLWQLSVHLMGEKKRVKRPHYNVCCVHTKEYNTVIKYDYGGLQLTTVKDDKEQFQDKGSFNGQDNLDVMPGCKPSLNK